MNHQQQLQDSGFRNWVRAGLGIKYLKEGLEHFIDNTTNTFHASILTGIPSTSVQCNVCTLQNLLPHPKAACPRTDQYKKNCPCNNTKGRRICPNGVCGFIYDAIVDSHRFKGPSWKNTKLSQWKTNHWQIAKCFMSPSLDMAAISTAAETECSGLLSVVINSTFIENFLTTNINPPNDTFSKARSMRNDVLHSASQNLSDAGLNNHIATFMDVLNTIPSSNTGFQAAQVAVEKLKQLQNDTFIITDEDVDKPRREALAAIIQGVEAIQRETVKGVEAMNKAVKSQAPSLPAEILRMDEQSIELYKQTLAEGNEASYTIRLMIVGHCGVGKTALTRRLLGDGFDDSNTTSTDGIDLHQSCHVNLKDGTWTVSRKDEKSDEKADKCVKRLARLLQQYFKNKADENLQHTEDGTLASPKVNVADTSQSGLKQMEVDTDILYSRKPIKTINIDNVDGKTQISADKGQSKKDLEEIVNEANTVNEEKEEADVSIWDFAGQYVYYSTHQVFHSRKAIYLLVTDISQDIDNVVMEDDLCNFDSDSTKCNISEYVEFWLNSIHSYCAPDIPPVILVGTHADQTEKPGDYFEAIRNQLDGKIAGTILEDGNFPIENKIEDPRLEDLKQKIWEVAKKQTYWGESIPGKWITLEQKLISLKDEGCKIIKRSQLSEINEQYMRVPLGDDPEKKELDLFLKFHHECGSLLYFSNEAPLNDFILLDPQWLVDALKSVITAKQFCKDKAALYKEWITFKKTAILKEALIDAIWKDKEASGTGTESFYTHRKYIILLMERLDIIAKPRLLMDDMLFRKEEALYFVPCVLTNDPPEDMSDSPTTTTTLCFKGLAKIYTFAKYNNLLAACISKWHLAKQGSSYQIYRGCGVFYLDSSRIHKLNVHLNFSQNVIQMWVSSMDEIDSSLSIGAKEFIIHHLESQGGFVTYIKCPTCGNLEQLDQLKASPRVRCEGGDGKGHLLESSSILQYWFREQRDQMTTKGFHKEREREEHKLFSDCSNEQNRFQPGSFIQTQNCMQSNVLQAEEMITLGHWSGSVCHIVFPGGRATGFRVGSKYIMTAKHVLDAIQLPGVTQVGGSSCATGLEPQLDKIHAVFDFLNPHAEQTNTFYFETKVHFEDDKTDSTILELKPSVKGSRMPTPFPDFGILSPGQVLWLIGHSEGKPKEFNKIHNAINMTSQETLSDIKTVKKWSYEKYNLYYDTAPYDLLDNQDRALFHCTFTKGASGSPGIIVQDSRVVVVTMLLHGYPDWFYDSSKSGLKYSVKPEQCIEQGARMEIICKKMKKKSRDLCKEIFGENC